MFGKQRQPTELIVGLDLGSSAIRVAIGQRLYRRGGGAPESQIIGVIETPAVGIQKGVVTSIEESVSSLSHALEQAERLVGIPIESAWVGMTSTHIVSQASKGVIAVAKTDGEIAEEDLDRAVEAARMVATPLNYDILHVVPRTFAVDGQTGIKDPVGMSGIRLEVDTQMIYGLSAHMKNITKAVYRTGIDIQDIVLSIFATGDVVTTPRQRDLGVAVANIGSATTSLIVYEDGDVIHTAVLPIGSEHITNDLAIGLRTSIDIAERVKIMYGQCSKEGLTKKDMVNLADAGALDEEWVAATYIVDIISARVAELLERIDKELRAIGKSGRLPAGVVLTGGGAKLKGIVEFSKQLLRLPAALGYPIDVQSTAERSTDIAFATAVGLVRWGGEVRDGATKLSRPRAMPNAGKFVASVQKMFKSLLP